MDKTGKLFLVPTPVGNLEDITLRAIRVLREADLILAEDTRNSSVLLRHHQIANKLASHHKFNEHKTLSGLIEKMKEGQLIALITDAGTPGISDPGFLIVRECLKHDIGVECLPGATAFVPALVVSGLPADRFVFEGFLPLKKGRQTRLHELVNEPRTMIFYESPFRLVKTITQFAEVFSGERNCCISREISKFYEEHFRGTLKEAIDYFSSKTPKGEFIIVLEGC